MWIVLRMVRLQLCFVSFFCTSALGNQNNVEFEKIPTFAAMENNIIDSNYIVQYANQHKRVHEIYRMRKKTNSTVRVSELFEKKRYHQCTVGVYQFFSEVGLSVQYFHQYTVSETFDNVPTNMG